MKHLLFILVTLAISLHATPVEYRIKSIKTHFVTAVDFLMPNKTTIELNNGLVLTTDVIEFELIDFIETHDKHVFIIFSGRTCSECDMRTQIYIKNVKDTSQKNTTVFSYPGKVKHYEDEKLLETSRMFYGKCLSDTNSSILFYSHYLNKDNKWGKSLFVTKIKKDIVVEVKTSLKYDNLPETLKFVKKGACNEIEGKEYLSEP